MTIDTTLVNDSDKVRIRNLTAFPAVYVTPSTHIRRELPPHGSMEVTAGELREASYDHGCIEMFRNYVQICNKELAVEFGVPEDMVEYHWSAKDIDDALLKPELYDAFLDALDFGPDGIKDSLVQRAVELEIPDVRRREAIKNVLGQDVTRMIENKHLIQANNDTQEEETPTKTRRATKTTKTRRAKTTKTE